MYFGVKGETNMRKMQVLGIELQDHTVREAMKNGCLSAGRKSQYDCLYYNAWSDGSGGITGKTGLLERT